MPAIRSTFSWNEIERIKYYDCVFVLHLNRNRTLIASVREMGIKESR